MYFVFVYICFCKYLSVKKEEKEIKMEKNEKDPIFWLETHTVTFQLSNRARKKMLWGGGVTHEGAQM